MASIERNDPGATTDHYVDFRMMMDRPFSPGRKEEIRSELDALRQGLRAWRAKTVACDRADGLEQAVDAMTRIEEFQRSEVQAAAVLARTRSEIDSRIRSGIDEADEVLARRNAVSAEETLAALVPVCGRDPRVEQARSRIAVLARRERTQKSEAAYADGRIAYAYMLSRKDPAMTTADREWSAQRHRGQIDALRKALEVKLAFSYNDKDAREVGEHAARSNQVHAVSTRTQPNTIAVSIETRGVALGAPQKVSSQTRSQKYVSGKQWVHNDAKDQCNAQAQALSNEAYRLQGQLPALEMTMNTCIQQVRQCKRQASQVGGWGGVAASLGCGVGEVACRTSYNSAVGKARSTSAQASAQQSTCAGMPSQKQVDQYAQHPYSAETWGVNASASFDVAIRLAPDQVVRKRLSATFASQDERVVAEPSYGVKPDPLTLPSPAQQRTALFEDLAAQLTDALVTESRAYWQVKRNAARRAASAREREDLLAEIWSMSDLLGPTASSARTEADRIEHQLVQVSR